MFRQLGRFNSQWWFLILGCWLAAFVGLRIAAPPFDDLAKGGIFTFLPENMASRQGEALLNRAFPGRQMTSNMVIVVHRDEQSGLTDADRSFIDVTLKPAVEQIRDRLNAPAQPAAEGSEQLATRDTQIITEIHTYSDRGIGDALISLDQKASLVTIELNTDFQDDRNWDPVQNVAKMIGDFQRGTALPKGLQLALTGSATLGRDLSVAEATSTQNAGPLTIAMVIVLLSVIYRAPLLALLPLVTLFIAVDVSLHLLTILAQAGYAPLFQGLQVYTTVITYGPGIDYCLFLIARYKENLQAGVQPKKALAHAIGQVGSAIVASGATVICGIGMLTFAQFGKFHEAGIGISIALTITLIATLSLMPALLCMTGHWAFWPKPGVRDSHQSEQPISRAEPDEPVVQRNLFQPIWVYMGEVIGRRPLAVLVVTLGGMLPFVALGLAIYDNVNYGLLESLPKSAISASSAVVLERDFPAGITGPIEVLMQNSNVDFRDEEGIAIVRNLVERLMKRKDELKIADIRSFSDPLGMTPPRREDSPDESSLMKAVENKATQRRSLEQYVSTVAEFDGHLTEIEIILSTNPFAIESVRDLDRIASAIRTELPADQMAKSTIAFVGPTASVRDINILSHSDQRRILLLVVLCVLSILIVLLRSIVLSIYLMVTVLLSYVATLGVTWLVFFSCDPTGFIGLDWTVPLFLFVVLIAVGADYNIFLVTRIHEEQVRFGPKQGIIIALSRTGGIITSCGVIMAGTFGSLAFGSLARMQQLGFALAFGVLLDTFIIRPILVPTFLMILNDPRYGNLSRYLK